MVCPGERAQSVPAISDVLPVPVAASTRSDDLRSVNLLIWRPRQQLVGRGLICYGWVCGLGSRVGKKSTRDMGGEESLAPGFGLGTPGWC
jgi:hypothetical protein